MDVLLHQNFIPHYRRLLFELLSSAHEPTITIASDDKPDSAGIPTAAPHDSAIRWLPCRSLKLASRFYWHPQLIGHVLRTKPDAVITMGNPYVLTAWALLLWGHLMRRPVLLWTHGLLSPETGFKGLIRRAFYRLASALLLYGDHAKKLLVDAGFDPRRMYVVYNSLNFEDQERVAAVIDEKNIGAFRESLNIQKEERMVVFSGRLQPNKKLSLCLEAASMLRDRGRTVHVSFIGSGNEQEPLAKLAERLGIEPLIHFLGESYDERFIATVFMASDLSIIPSGAGLSVMHAMGYGVPVLVHDRPSEHFPEWEAVMQGETGFFYRYGDVKDLADKMEAALFPAAQKERMKEACLAVIRERYNATTHAAGIISAVNQVIESAR